MCHIIYDTWQQKSVMVHNLNEAALEKAELPVKRVAALFGGKRILRQDIGTSIDAHRMIEKGLPTKALNHLVGSLVVLDQSSSLGAMGMSVRTFQRHRDEPTKSLSVDQGGRAWKFAEILAKAIGVFGSQENAEQWLKRPALGLDGNRPLELLTTPAGVEMVEDFLTQLEYGVYV